jgi:hypothetical protein
MNSDTLTLASVLIFLAVVTIVAWLGGGRKWAFRALLSLLILFVVGVVGVIGYYIWDEHSTNVRIKRLHACSVAKVAAPKCVPAQGGGKIPKGALVCPMYLLSENPTPQQEEDALTTAQKECEEEEGKVTSLHDEISRYREQHGVKPDMQLDDPYASIAKPIKTKLSVTVCADKIKKKYPGAYTDFDDATLVRKVLAKYPTYCDVPNDPPGWEPVIEGIH